ncbi:unnamed protein product [marine sediment metagenome]|uniref:Carbohydrate kinase FGGY N-terminal domain-containing protein n=1 Tax=marine sediment metagenome TaxID=412755 RepID=X1DA86_9ZZZZ
MVKPMSDRLFAVFDIGTTGTRSVLVDEEGREVSKAYEEYPQKPKEVKTHEQIADTYWRTSANTMQRAIAGCKHGAEAIVGVIVTTTRDRDQYCEPEMTLAAHTEKNAYRL